MLDRLVDSYFDSYLLSLVAVPYLMCTLAAAITGRRDEFGLNATQNTVATAAVMAANYGILGLFHDDFSRWVADGFALLQVPTLPAGVWDGWPIWATCLVAIVAKDFADYWSHRLMHLPWAWPTHAAHHSDTHVNAFTTYRVHALEIWLMVGVKVVMLTWMQLPDQIPLVILITVVHNHYVHLNLPWRHGPLKYLIASPVYHRWHHADVPEAYGKNLANVMPLWDVLFGTYYEPGLCEEEVGALKSGVADKNPISILIYPFQEWARLIRKALSPKPRTDPPQTPAE